MATYSYVTLATAQQELANRLYDSTMQQWSAAELTLLIQEAIRVFNSLTFFQRGDFVFNVSGSASWVSTSIWYDLTQLSNTLRPLTITDNLLTQQVEYSILEPVTSTYPLAWSGSAQFSLDDILNAMQRRRDEILSVTGCAITQSTIPATSQRSVLADSVIDLRRVAYFPVAANQPNAVTLWQSDKWGMDSYAVNWTLNPPGMPSTYILSTDPTLSFDLDRQPGFSGSLELLTVNAGAPLSLTAASTFTIPDDWTWLLRWGTLADLLGRDSNASDPLRAKYAEGRYRQGLQLLSAAPALLGLRVNNIPIQVSSVRHADAYQVGWEAAAPGAPTEALVAGLNLVALSPQPDTGTYSLTATVVRNAPVPVLLTDFLQVPRDAYDIILDECVHTALFKSGGAEFLASQPLHDRFMQLCALYSSKLDEQGEFTKILLGLSQREEDANPRYSADLEVGVEE